MIAREGQPHKLWANNDNGMGSLQNERVQKTIVIKPEHVAISIEKPLGRRDHTPFWDAYWEAVKAMKPTPQQ